MAKSKKDLLTVRIDRETMLAIEQFCSDLGLSKSDGVNVLLASGLGRRRHPEGGCVGGITVAASDHDRGNGNGHAPDDDESDENGGEGLEVPTVPPPAPPEPPPIQATQASDVADHHIAELVGRVLWGCTAAEQRIAATNPSWIAEVDANQLRPRFMALIAELDRLRIPRFSAVSEAFLSARCGGLSFEDARDVPLSQGPFRRSGS